MDYVRQADTRIQPERDRGKETDRQTDRERDRGANRSMKQSTRQSDIKFDIIAQTHTLLTFIVSNYLTECFLLHSSVLFNDSDLRLYQIQYMIYYYYYYSVSITPSYILEARQPTSYEISPAKLSNIYNEVQSFLAQLTELMVKPVKSSLSVCLCVNLDANWDKVDDFATFKKVEVHCEP